MARIPLEDNFNDIVAKAQRGLKISDADLASRAEVTIADLTALKSGRPNIAVLRRVARHLRLGPDALEVSAHKTWYPQQPNFPTGFAAFNTTYEDMAVNSYLVWGFALTESPPLSIPAPIVRRCSTSPTQSS